MGAVVILDAMGVVVTLGASVVEISGLIVFCCSSSRVTALLSV